MHPKGNQSWIFIERTDAEAETPNTLSTWCEELTPWKRPWCWERLKAGEGNDRGWDGWMASPTWWTWVWASSRVGDRQGGLVCCSPWGRNKLDTTERLNWTEAWPCFNKFLLLCPRVETANSPPISCPSTCDTISFSGFLVLTLLNRMFCLQLYYIAIICSLNYEAFNKNCVFLLTFFILRWPTT